MEEKIAQEIIVGVRFKKAGRIYYFSPGRLELTPGTKVIVETARGVEYGEVVVGPKKVRTNEINVPLKPVLRVATAEDEARISRNKQKAAEAFTLAQERIALHKLPMKLADVEYTFDGTKVLFYFSADGRVDFRELVRDLASQLHMRIELRQIGVRDQAKMLGGLGCCGRPLCCATFLGDFEPVSIRMAKEQNLSLNPLKISGICGRLMCCLKFESDSYRQERACAEESGEPSESEDDLPPVDELELETSFAESVESEPPKQEEDKDLTLETEAGGQGASLPLANGRKEGASHRQRKQNQWWRRKRKSRKAATESKPNK